MRPADARELARRSGSKTSKGLKDSGLHRLVSRILIGFQGSLKALEAVMRNKLSIFLVVVAALVVADLSVNATTGETPSTATASQGSTLPIVLPATPVQVAPGQPAVGTDAAATPDSSGVRTATPTAGIINALCNVRLNIVGCGFLATSISLGCDTNGDGIPDSTIQLTDVTPIDANLVQATLSTTASGAPGTAFPLACCGGLVTLTMQRTVSAGDDNIFGPFTQTQTSIIDVGLRAPVVDSVSPSQGDCGSLQNLVIPGSCFILPDGTANVTSVFAIDKSQSTNIVQAARFVVLTPNLIDAAFDFGPDSAGKVFYLYASGPSGTSRNLISVPDGAQGCPLGNELGVSVTFACNAPAIVPPKNVAVVTGCFADTSGSGKFLLTITGGNIQAGASVTIGGVQPRKVKFTQLDSATNTYGAVVASGGLCGSLPGLIVITNPSGSPSLPFQCNRACGQ
jgi:hypothetical protein